MLRFGCLMLLWWLLPGASASAGEPVPSSSSAWFENPARTRGLLGSTALPLHEGEGFIGQQALFATVAEVGLSERVSVSVASAVPVVALARTFSDVPFSLMGGIKVTRPLTERLHLAFGVQGGSFDSDLYELQTLNAVAVYGILTYGTGDAHVSLTVQPFVAWGSFHSGSVMVLPMLGGFVRLGEHWGLAGEVALSPVDGVSGAFGFATAGARFMGRHWSLDLGVLAEQKWKDADRPSVLPGGSFLFHWR
ncbi:hypothetical protein D7Y13_08780 [Corallococcus praedator]|uniref:YjbH domain-containing protein n=1 Tax=Corallococcus praedator TaxID=2316724 RepID=A0ABX9QLQ3_9BACT|nr:MULTISPECIES: hypothetical protein [Corallococcus]RKH33133.1 hypothetical protein D7X75_13315 [Corallococcus sp. CA031C]RKI12755.1 hypothetical protein D7Y13_08780 [Corallococcus praedator]